MAAALKSAAAADWSVPAAARVAAALRGEGEIDGDRPVISHLRCDRSVAGTPSSTRQRQEARRHVEGSFGRSGRWISERTGARIDDEFVTTGCRHMRRRDPPEGHLLPTLPREIGPEKGTRSPALRQRIPRNTRKGPGNDTRRGNYPRRRTATRV